MRKTRSITIAILLILAAIYYQPVRAADLYVDVALGTNSPTCGTASGASACKTITYTVAIRAVANDTVHVGMGTYNTASGEVFPISITKNLTLIAYSAVTTIIDATGSNQNVISVSGAYVVNIYGFTIRNGVRGLYYRNGASGNIENNVIERNAHNGIQNGDTSGAGTAANPTIRFNYISQNGIISSVSGIRNNFSNPVIHTNVIDRNYYGIFNSNSSPTITNNTIVGNTVHGIANNTLSSPTMTNNIITNNGTLNWHRGIHSDGTGTVTNDYNDVWNNPGGNYSASIIVGAHSISQDPLFVSYPTDLHLLCTPTQSPAIDTGNNVVAITFDIEMSPRPRPAGGTVDMGAFEADCVGPVTSNTMAFPNPTNCAANVTLTARVDDSITGNSSIAGAEYFTDALGGNGTGTAMSAQDGFFDGVIENVTASVPVGVLSTGPHTIYVHGRDVLGNWGATQSYVLNVVNDCSGPITSSTLATPNPTNCAVYVNVTARVDDSTTGNSSIQAVEYFIDASGANGTGTVMNAQDGTFDSPIENVTATKNVLGLLLGDHILYVHGQDALGNWGTLQSITLTVSCSKARPAAHMSAFLSMLPVAQHNISKAEILIEQAQGLLSQAQQKSADCTKCENLIREATELLTKANTVRTNPIYANNLALQAITKLKQAIDCLKALVG